MKIFTIYLIIIGAMSLVAFFTYLADKIKARNGSWRIRESVLLGLGFLGGAAGALASMALFRHKTRHFYFWLINGVSLALHAAAGILIFIKFAVGAL